MSGRKIFGIILALCLLALPVSAEVVAPTSDFYVYDGADVLSSETESYIITTNRELESKTGAQIVVVTVPSLEGQALEEYAVALFRAWGIGDKEKNNGVLLLCALEERQFRVEVGYGLEGDLPDGKTGRMQDEYIIPLLKEDKFDEGIKNGYSAFLLEVAAVYEIDSITGQMPVEYDNAEEELGGEFVICLVIGWLISFLGSVFLLKKKKPKLSAVFWGLEALQVVVFSIVLQSFFNGIWIAGTGLAFGLGLGMGKPRYRGYGGHWGGSGRGGFGGGFSGGGFGGFSGGGGRSGGGGSSRGF